MKEEAWALAKRWMRALVPDRAVAGASAGALDLEDFEDLEVAAGLAMREEVKASEPSARVEMDFRVNDMRGR